MSDGESSRPGKLIPLSSRILVFGPFRFDRTATRLYRGDVEIHLVPKAAAVLETLLARPGVTVSKERFFNTVWEGIHVGDESLTQTVSTIRQALGDAAHSPEYIQTAPGRGYRFIAPVSYDGQGPIGVAESVPTVIDGWPATDASKTAEALEPPGGPESELAVVLAWAVAALSLAIVAGMWLAGPSSGLSAPDLRVVRFTETLPPGRALVVGGEAGRRWGANPKALALSPDGGILAYTARENGSKRLYLRSLDGGDAEARLVEHSEGGNIPFFSPDSQWLGFKQHGWLHRVPVYGGLPLEIAEYAGRGASWGRSDMIAYNVMSWRGLGIVSPASGGEPRGLTNVDTRRRDMGHQDPHFLPDGRAVLYTSWIGGGRDASTVSAVELSTGATKVILERASFARYMDPGYLVFVSGGQLQVQAFDPVALEVSGTPVAFCETERGLYDVSRLGDLAYIPMPRNHIGSQIVAVDRSGRPTSLISAPNIALQTRVSPDGRRLLVSQVEPDGGQYTWILDPSGEAAPSQVTFDGNSALPMWSPDGKWVAYNSDQRGPWETFVVPADGPGTPEVLIEGDSFPYGWHPTLPHFLFRKQQDFWVLDLESTEGPRRLFAEPELQADARFSPDGKWLLYSSDIEGQREVFVRPYPDVGQRVKVSRGGGRDARWSPDGREVYYIQGDDLVAAAIDYTTGFSAAAPHALFDVSGYGRAPGGLDYDVAPDGRFVMVPLPAEEVHTEIKLVLNFVEHVKERIPPGGRGRGALERGAGEKQR